MKKIIFYSLMLLGSVSAFANYDALQFNYTDGSTKVVDSAGLTIIVDNGTLQITNTGGDVFSVDASSLTSMQFTSDDATGGVNSIVEVTGSVEVYSVDGVYAGKFTSIDEAKNSLSNGIYVLKDTQGKSAKIRVNR